MDTLAPTFALASDTLEAEFDPAHGMLATSLRHRGTELLGPAGIPFLYPWANRLEADLVPMAGAIIDATGSPHEEHGLPIHGLPAAFDGVTLDWDDDAFPFPHRITVVPSIEGPTLTITTTVEAHDRAVPLSFGFHPYFQLPNVPRSQWRIELPSMRRLELDGRLLPTGRSQRQVSEVFALGSRVYDDGYVAVEPGAIFALSGGGRRIEVCFEQGFACAQVFAPPTEDVICFEPMVAPTNALATSWGLPVLQPGETATATWSITVRP